MRFASIVFVLLSACTTGEDIDIPTTCSMAETTPDTGELAALFTQRCNVSGSMGMRKWYRVAATLPATTDVVQLELFDGAGPFAGGVVRPGTFPVDADPVTCGVCVRALGDKGGTEEMELYATSGTVTITELGANGTPFSATISDVMFEQVADKVVVDGGCTADVARVTFEGTMMDRGGTGGGGGGGGGGGMGGCATTVGDPDKI